MIQAHLKDGRVLEFPDGTDPAVIQSTVQRTLGIQQVEQSQIEGQQFFREGFENLSPSQRGSILQARQQRLESAGLPQDIASSAVSREQQLSALSPEQRSLVEDIGPIEAAAIGAGRGLTNIGRAIGLADPEDPAARQGIESLRSSRPVAVGVGEIAGETAPFLPLGLAAGSIKATVPRALATAGAGAVEGGLIARGEQRDIGQQLVSSGIGGSVAGALELAVPILGRLGGKIVRRVNNQAPTGAVVDLAGNPSDELLDALQKSGQSFDDLVREAQQELTGEALDPDQAARSSILRSQGLEPTRAQITRNAADFQAQQEAAKTSNAVRNALERQEAVLTSRFDNAILKTGGDSSAPTSTVFDAITEKATVLDQQISDLYTLARNTAPDVKNVRLASLASKLKRSAPSDRASGGVVKAIIGDLKAKGILDKNLKVVGRINVDTAEDVRKLMNELYDPQKPFGNALLRNFKDALDDDVFRASGDDIFRQAREAKASFERDLSRAKISKFDSRRANLVRDVLENKVDPDRLTEQVVFSKKWRSNDVEQLKNYISTTPAGRQAFNDFRAETLQQIKERSFVGAVDDAGNQTLSRDKLERAIKSIGDKKLKVLFNPEERRFLNSMLSVSKLREPVRGTALGRGPSAQAIARLERSIEDIPIFGNLISSISSDAKGRAVLKGNPQRLTQPLRSSPLTAAATLPVAAAAVQQQDQ